MTKAELKRYRRLLDELERECQELGHTLDSQEEKDDLTSWCQRNLDSKVEYLKTAEEALVNQEIREEDSASNVSSKSITSGSVVSARVQATIRRRELELELAFKKKVKDLELQRQKIEAAAKSLADQKEFLSIEEAIEKERMKEAELSFFPGGLSFSSTTT